MSVKKCDQQKNAVFSDFLRCIIYINFIILCASKIPMIVVVIVVVERTD